MPKFTFRITYTTSTTQEGEVTVEADDEEAALRKADDENMAGRVEFDPVGSDELISGPNYELITTEEDDAP